MFLVRKRVSASVRIAHRRQNDTKCLNYIQNKSTYKFKIQFIREGFGCESTMELRESRDEWWMRPTDRQTDKNWCVESVWYYYSGFGNTKLIFSVATEARHDNFKLIVRQQNEERIIWCEGDAESKVKEKKWKTQKCYSSRRYIKPNYLGIFGVQQLPCTHTAFLFAARNPMHTKNEDKNR